MFSRLKELLNNKVHVQIFSHGMNVKKLDDSCGIFIEPVKPYSTERLLIGNFDGARETMKKGLRVLFDKKYILPSPVVIIEPMDKSEGGLSQVEERVLLELGISSGARKVEIKQ
jgi:rod shape-determining protein MreB